MLYGTVPFKAAQMNDLHRSIIEGKYTLKNDISEEARDLISHLLEVDVKDRFGFNEIIKHKWFVNFDNNSIIK